MDGLKAERDALLAQVEALECRLDPLDSLVSDTMFDNNRLTRERNALAAQNELLHSFIESVMANIGAGATLDEVADMLCDWWDTRKTPQQCLLDVQAETIQAGLDAIGAPVTKFAKMSDQFVAGFNFCAALLQQYATKVRQGGAE